ncbi:MAG: DUF3237 domain-containing protein [Proteobacteria bacterium]|nr:DUF3237 domain-containing protein [Pseudomonadota bacterium]MBU4471683.1 DUF3237 domain-containing protein [Pseudomonadota bacterium]MCG2750658.1 DUF3237 domain-containing protein [Desulfobacteraceae bacterium]
MYVIDRLEHLCSYKADVTNRVNFGDTPFGKRYDVYFEGSVTGQKLSGKMHGIDYVLKRSDGIAELNVKAVLVTEDNVNVSVQISGYMNGEELKDTQIKMVTGHEKYSWLMSKIIIGKGKAANNRLELDYYYEP